MDTVTLSPKFQVVIPKRVRRKMSLCAGVKFEVISFDDRIGLLLALDSSAENID